MAEFKVRVWRRTTPLVGDSSRIINLERDEVSLEATSLKSALLQVFDAEQEAGGKHLRVYVMVDRPEGGHLGMGDYTLCELAFKEKQERRAQSGDSEK